MEKTHRPLIRTIYLYLFALIGLAMMIIGTARLLDLGLQEYVFQVQDDVYVYERPLKFVDDQSGECVLLSKEEREVLKAEEKERYERDLEQQKRQARERKKRTLSEVLSMIVVGLPVWLYHWKIIQKDLHK